MTTLNELEQLAKDVEARGDRVMILSTGKVIRMCELLREMGNALENCVDYFDGCTVNGKDTEPEAAIEAAESARKQFAKYKEMTK